MAAKQTRKRDPRGAKAKDATGKTQLELATAAGVSLSTWKQWQSDEKLNGAELADRKKRAEIRRIEIESEKVSLQLSVVAEELLPRKEIEEAIAQIAAVQGSCFSAIESEMPSLLDGLPAAKIEKEVRSFTDTWRETMRRARENAWVVGREAVRKMTKGDLKKAAGRRDRDQ